MYSTNIEPSEDSLRMLDEKFTQVAEDRFFYSLQQTKWTIEDVRNFNNRLLISFDYTNKEFERIKELRKTYNKEYPTNHKKYFSTVIELMSKMRSTLSGYKKIADGFRPKKKRGTKIKEGASAFDRTPLCNGEYSQDVFGWDTYPDQAVKDLHKNLNDYLELAGKCLQLCLEIIDEEKAIRSDPEWAYALYQDSFRRSVNNSKCFIDLMKQQGREFNHDIVKAVEEAENVKQLIAELFHTFNYSDFNYFCACKTIHDGRKAGLTDDESKLFGKDNKEKVMRIRALLDHIQELANLRTDVIGWHGMLSGQFVMHLLYWCGWDGTKNVGMLNYITNRCKDKIDVVQMGAVMRAKRMAFKLDNKVRHEQQAAFEVEIDQFVDSIMMQTAEKHD